MICDNISYSPDGFLLFAGQNVSRLCENYGTPLYLMDAEKIRHNCRIYKNALAAAFGDRALPLFASKACSFKDIYRIMSSEGMGIDVVSCGEIFTAFSAGFDLSKAFFHGNCKTDADIAYAMDHKVGYFVADNRDELIAVSNEAKKRNITQKVILRLTPGIDTHTYEAVNTGKVDSKFGAPIETGQAEELAVFASSLPDIELCGFHCHVGSQVFGEDVFERTADIMISFIGLLDSKYSIKTKILDLGGGYGVRYVESDPFVNIPEKIASVAERIKTDCEKAKVDVPFICLEPGRSIVADAGMTAYTVGSVKEIPGYKNYVAVDGGMTDNPRFALYKSRYTVLAAQRKNAPEFVFTLAGRNCESGDILAENVRQPKPERGDYIAVATTGAYNFSMSSEYNRVPRPPVVMIDGEKTYVAVRRQTFEDVAERDV